MTTTRPTPSELAATAASLRTEIVPQRLEDIVEQVLLAATQYIQRLQADAARDAVEQLTEAFQVGGWSDSVLPALRRQPTVPAIAISQAVTDWHCAWIATHHPKEAPDA